MRNDIEKYFPEDHAINVAKAALSAVPIIGGVLASLVGDYIPQKREQRLIGFVKDLAKRLSDVANDVNTQYIKSEKFVYLFEEACRLAAQKYDEDIVHSARNVLVNSSVRVDVEQDVKEEFLRILGILRGSHLLILSYLAERDLRSERFPYRGPSQGIRNESDQPATIIKSYCLYDADKGLIRSMFNLLVGLGLIDDPYQVEVLTVLDVKKTLTPFGKLFLEFVDDR